MADDMERQGCCAGSKKLGTGKPILIEFRDFLLGGNLIRVAVAFVMALAVSELINQFVKSFITPIIGIIGGTDFDSLTFKINGSNFTYGSFLDELISFLVLTIVVFFCLVLPVQRYGGLCVPSWIMRKCPFCFQDTPAIATKCPHCCSEIEAIPIGKTAEIEE